MRKIRIFKEIHEKHYNLSDFFINDLNEILPDWCNILYVVKYKKEDLPLKYR